MLEATTIRNGIIEANPALSRFSPLPRILCYDDFDYGINGWCELLGNHDGDLEKVRPVQADFRPPQISNCTFFDIGTHGAMNGNYALKLQTRPEPGHMALALKRLTSVKPGLVQLETYFAVKSEAWIGKRGEEIDGNIDPSLGDFGDFCISNDISNGDRRAHCCVRYVNCNAKGELVQKWQAKTSLQVTSKLEWSGSASRATDYHVRDPDDWQDIPDGQQALCYNELPTKINWHYLRWQFDTGTFRNVLLQVNNKVMHLEDVVVPEYERGFHQGLTNLMNLSVDVRTHSPVRNFIWFDSILTSVDW
ncbi:DUF6772 family protein [Nitratireductor sp. XY-223]|uniref:DUF6772 family protein n=1 Tax=Nitratireductor sp. XY-223 TaxID=2561926 RepID=UPI0010AA4283|nr:DUF6772 family protein [Nitratireductor sp. XY-223]